MCRCDGTEKEKRQLVQGEHIELGPGRVYHDNTLVYSPVPLCDNPWSAPCILLGSNRADLLVVKGVSCGFVPLYTKPLATLPYMIPTRIYWTTVCPYTSSTPIHPIVTRYSFGT